jgi:hypothetical protein
MAKVMLKGWFDQILSPKKVGENNDIDVQEVVFVVPGFVDGFGDKKGKDSPWLIQIFGDEAIKKFALTDKNEKQKAEISIFMDGFCSQKDKDKAPYFGYTAKLAELKLHPGKVEVTS